ncbi:DUF2931 family protein [Flavobacterium plurextorum]|uniref:DUF2931 family protein n=1 Tax=Flavobacterium plurextorum TaxID=1114867 RepID=UPI0037577CD8
MIDSYGAQQQYDVIVAGMAPGGNVTIWMQGGTGSTEICRFKAKNKGIWKENDPDYSKYIKEHRSLSDGFKESSTYWKIHGIPYSVWEKGEKEYDYDIGFSSEDNSIKPEITTFYSKDGSLYQASGVFDFETIDWNTFKYLPNNNRVKKHKLPIQILAEWEQNSIYYSTNIVFTQNFEKIFLKSFKSSTTNKIEHFDRIVIGIKKGGNDGLIWIEGNGKRMNVMNFKIFKAKKNEMGTYIGGGYSLSKDFVFPKWEGREPIVFPELDYWQEK